MDHVIECAFRGSTKQTFLVPVLEAGMYVRDFATHIRDIFKIPEHTDVILCEAVHGAPFKGLHWLMPQTGVQICLRHNAHYVEAITTPIMPAVYSSEKKSDSQKQSQTMIGLECWMVSACKAVGGYVTLHSNLTFRDNQSDVCCFTLENVTSQKDCEMQAAAFVAGASEDSTAIHFVTSLIHVCKSNEYATTFQKSDSELSTKLRNCVVKTLSDHVESMFVY